ncbi:YheE family protein [Neobacillus sp. PS3-34]|uniref:YheE family protein n=1 Tax=Neobacillus sp. PS3-34 TaxID=3070678 RepID=UPI0027E145FE|nr:YheE family protein [Neobacillus sp. PS3-34]WML50540.1 YheE family protein [Neobacillus sp. PS3-34]
MLTHFQFKPLFENKKIPGWQFSFYFKRQKITGIYHQNGEIEWSCPHPGEEDEDLLKKQLHELMLFHVYDER